MIVCHEYKRSEHCWAQLFITDLPLMNGRRRSSTVFVNGHDSFDQPNLTYQPQLCRNNDVSATMPSENRNNSNS